MLAILEARICFFARQRSKVLPATGILEELDLSRGLRPLTHVVQNPNKGDIILPVYMSQLMNLKARPEPGHGLKSHASIQKGQAELRKIAVALLNCLFPLIRSQPLRDGRQLVKVATQHHLYQGSI